MGNSVVRVPFIGVDAGIPDINAIEKRLNVKLGVCKVQWPRGIEIEWVPLHFELDQDLGVPSLGDEVSYFWPMQ